MVHYFRDADRRVIDKALSIIDLYTGKGTPLDCVIGELDGFHGTFINHKSDKNYLVLAGNGMVSIGDAKFFISEGDFIRIPVGVKHSIEGCLKFALICNPPYELGAEDVI